jgi:HEAT repeat protein
MKSKGWIILVVVLVIVVAAVAAVFLDPTYTVRGWLGGERFFAGRPVSYWKNALLSADPAVEAKAFAALKDGGKEAVPVLTELLAAQGATPVRWKAADLLAHGGPDAREAVPALIAALKDSDRYVRVVAAASLGLVVPKESCDEAVEALGRVLPEGGTVAATAARAISKFGAKGAPALPALLEAMKDRDSTVRWEAGRTVGKIGAAAKSAVPALVEQMKDESPLVREHAAEALGDIGPEAKDAVPALIERLKDPVARVRRDAVRSLGQIGPAAKPALEPARGLLKDEDEAVRTAAEKTVRILGK